MTAKGAKCAYITVSVLLCVLGVLLMIFPSVSAVMLCYLLGGLSVLYGIAKIVGYFSHDLYNLAFQFDLALGLFVLAVGLLLVFQPKHVIGVFQVIIGLFVLIDGVFKLQTSLDAKRFGLPHWWLIMLGGLLCMAMGLVLMIDPFAAGSALMVFVGVSLLVDGAQNLFNALYTVKIMKRAGQTPSVIVDDQNL